MLKKFTQIIFIVFFLMLTNNFVASAQQPILVITNPPAAACQPIVDITTAFITAGSTLPAGTTLSYYHDVGATIVLTAPNAINTSGTYYIKATSPGGLTDIKPVTVTVNPTPILIITNPAAVNSPSTVDITVPAITAGSTLPAGTILGYYADVNATITLANPAAIAVSGTYYIKAITISGCGFISPVVVTINTAPAPVLVITNPAAVCSPGTVDITNAAVTTGSTLPAGTTISYYTDAAATIPYTTPSTVTASGTYYIKATSLGGLTDVVNVTVIVNPTPILIITNPAAVNFPSTVDITVPAITAGSTLPVGTTLGYYTDAAATTVLADPAAIATSGTYYIKAITGSGCMSVSAVTVTINTVAATPVLVIQNPAAVCAPTTVDITNPDVAIDYSILPAGTTLSYYTDAATTIPVANPTAIAISGTYNILYPYTVYYIKATTPSGNSDIEPVAVTIYAQPAAPIVSNISFCQGTTAAPLTAMSDSGSTLLWYQTPTGGGLGTSIVPTPSTTNADITTYYVAQVISNGSIGCVSPRAALTVTTNPIPTLEVTNPAPVCSPAVVDITVPALVTFSPANTVLSYYSDANATTALTSPTAIGTSGTYYVEGITPLGCSTINSVIVSVSNNCKASEPVSVYPDPANQTLTLSFNPNETGDGYFELINDKGQVVIKMSIIYSSSIPINVSSMPEGKYYYVIRKPNGQKLKVGQLIIIH